MKKIILIAISVALAYSSIAYSACGWILWHKNLKDSSYSIENTYQSYNDCIDAKKRSIQAYHKFKDSGFTTMGDIVKINDTQNGINEIFQIQCIPSDLDPRRK